MAEVNLIRGLMSALALIMVIVMGVSMGIVVLSAMLADRESGSFRAPARRQRRGGRPS